MPTLDDVIDDLVAGDDKQIERTIDRSESDLGSGVTLTKAWMTVRATRESTLNLLQKVIDTNPNAGVGQITDDGTGDTDPVVLFELSPTDTRAIGTTPRHFDIQVRTSGLKNTTPNAGAIFCTFEVTEDDT